MRTDKDTGEERGYNLAQRLLGRLFAPNAGGFGLRSDVAVAEDVTLPKIEPRTLQKLGHYVSTAGEYVANHPYVIGASAILTGAVIAGGLYFSGVFSGRSDISEQVKTPVAQSITTSVDSTAGIETAQLGIKPTVVDASVQKNPTVAQIQEWLTSTPAAAVSTETPKDQAKSVQTVAASQEMPLPIYIPTTPNFITSGDGKIILEDPTESGNDLEPYLDRFMEIYDRARRITGVDLKGQIVLRAKVRNDGQPWSKDWYFVDVAGNPPRFYDSGYAPLRLIEGEDNNDTHEEMHFQQSESFDRIHSRSLGLDNAKYIDEIFPTYFGFQAGESVRGNNPDIFSFTKYGENARQPQLADYRAGLKDIDILKVNERFNESHYRAWLIIYALEDAPYNFTPKDFENLEKEAVSLRNSVGDPLSAYDMAYVVKRVSGKEITPFLLTILTGS